MAAFANWVFWRVFVGLLQIVVLVLVLLVMGLPIDWFVVLGNGALLFFATGLLGSSIHRLQRNSSPKDVQTLALGYAITLCILTLTVVTYMAAVLSRMDLLGHRVRPNFEAVFVFQGLGVLLAIWFAWKVDP